MTRDEVALRLAQSDYDAAVARAEKAEAERDRLAAKIERVRAVSKTMLKDSWGDLHVCVFEANLDRALADEQPPVERRKGERRQRG